MDFDQNNVLVGLSKLLVDGVSVGFTQGGVVLGLTTDRVDKEVDQSFSPIGILKVRERYELSTNLAETTLENLKLVWEQTASIVVDAGPPPTRTLKWGINEAVVEHDMRFFGKSPEGFDRTFRIFKAVVFEVGDMPHQRDAITVIPVTFRILPDTTQPAGEEYGKITDFGSEDAPLLIDDVFDSSTITESVSLSIV